MVTMPTRACVAIPAVLRRRAAFGPGDGVLLAAVSPSGHARCPLIRRAGSGHPRPRYSSEARAVAAAAAATEPEPASFGRVAGLLARRLMPMPDSRPGSSRGAAL